jgi:hypothetical protein
MSDAITIKITLNFHDGNEPRAAAQVIDVPAHEVFEPALVKALPKPRPWWRSKTPNLLDGAVLAGALATCWWLLS